MGVTVHGVPALPGSRYSLRPHTDYLTVHCADTTADWDGDVSEVRRWHQQERGWIDVGYHYFIRRSGMIQRGRPRWAMGAHVAGHNHESLGICMAGGTKVVGNERVEDNNFTPEQWASLTALLKELKEIYPKARINGHRDFPGVTKYCPSFDVAAWLTTNPI